MKRRRRVIAPDPVHYAHSMVRPVACQGNSPGAPDVRQMRARDYSTDTSAVTCARCRASIYWPGHGTGNPAPMYLDGGDGNYYRPKKGRR